LKQQSNENKQLLLGLPALVPPALVGSTEFQDSVKNSSKAGTCEASAPNGCVDNAVKRNTDPIGQKVDAGNAVRDANDAAQTGLLTSLLANLASFRAFVTAAFQNTIIDKVISYLTLFTTIHNATMLSRDIGETLGSTLDNALNIVGLRIKDAEGNQIGVTSVIGTSIQNMIKGAIGTANYTALTESWAKANRIYQSAINGLDATRSLFDSARSLNELTGNNIGKIGNALVKDGVVSEDAYHRMSENTTQFNVLMERLERAENAVSTLSSISGEILSIQENITQLNTARNDFNTAITDKEPKTIPDNVPIKTKLETDKSDSIYTIGDFSIAKEPDDPTP
jgi:hypothetical protein